MSLNLDNLPIDGIYYRWDYESTDTNNWSIIDEMKFYKEYPLVEVHRVDPVNKGRIFCKILAEDMCYFSKMEWYYPKENLNQITREEVEAMIIMAEMK